MAIGAQAIDHRQSMHACLNAFKRLLSTQSIIDNRCMEAFKKLLKRVISMMMSYISLGPHVYTCTDRFPEPIGAVGPLGPFVETEHDRTVAQASFSESLACFFN